MPGSFAAHLLRWRKAASRISLRSRSRSLYRSYNATKHVITFYNGEFAVAIGRHHIHDSETSVVTRRKRLMQIALDAVDRPCPKGFTGCAQNSPPTLTPQPERASGKPTA